MARGSVPCADSHDPVAAHQGRQHEEGLRQSVPCLRFDRCNRGCGSGGRRRAHPSRGIPQAEGRRYSQMLQDPPRRIRREGPEQHRGAGIASYGREEDRRLRPLLRHGDPVRMRRYPCAQDSQPHGAGPHEGSGGHRARSHGDHAGGQVERYQPLHGEARAGRVPAESSALREVRRPRLLRLLQKNRPRTPAMQTGFLTRDLP